MGTPEIAALISFGVLMLSIFQTMRQQRLIERTSELEAEVNRLSIELDQSLKRLHRANELARRAYGLCTTIYNFRQHKYSVADLPDLVGCILELEALISVIGDNNLLEYMGHFEAAYDSLRNTISITWQDNTPTMIITAQQEYFDALGAIGDSIRNIHRRVYELLETTSQPRSATEKR